MLVNRGACFCTGKSKTAGDIIEQVIKTVDLEEIPSEDYLWEAKQ